MSTEDSLDIIQLVAFRVGSEEYVLDIMRVHEIMRPLPITQVRKGPKFVEGVINLRGTVLPVLDLRQCLDLPPLANQSSRKFIILAAGGRALGLVVDSVTDVVRVPRSAIRPAPHLLGSAHAPYFLGVCHHKTRSLILLNIRAVVEQVPKSLQASMATG